MRNDSIYSGTSGIVSPVPRSLYPLAFREKSRLHYYSTLFNSVEINSTFYKLPKAATIQKWIEDVPPHFRFTFKLPKLVSHSPQLKYNRSDLEAFIRLLPDSEKVSCLLVQFPSSLAVESLPQLKKLLHHLSSVGNHHRLRMAVEFRNDSWYSNEVFNLLKAYNVAIVIHDFPKGTTPSNVSTADFMYWRLHGPEPRYRGSYSIEFLSDLANQLHDCLKKGATAFTYFNNTMGDAYDNLVTLNRLVEERQKVE